MNAVEISDAVSALFEQPFDRTEFPFAFLEAFGNKETTIKRLRSGNSNASDVPGGLLQKNNIHLAICAPGAVGETLQALKTSPKTAANRVKYLLATDGEWLEAEDVRSGEPLATAYAETPAHFGFFLELAGITTVREIKDNPIDIRATARLNKLYVELLSANEEWRSEARRPDLNHFFARLIFCFFAEDTGIFHGEGLFTRTVDRMTESDGSNVHVVLETLFRAMNLSLEARKTANLPLWAEPFPYVNGGLFSGSAETPRFTRIARAYLRSAGELNWREINPDIFGSMIQAVADDEERGALGMHYTSVPNILKVLNPLFLDDLRAQLEKAGDHKPSLLKLRERMAHIRVFDPACGSGNFLVIAYKQMREIEAEINRRRGEDGLASAIPLTNFRGIEIRDFAAEIARLALIIAEYQADVLYRGERLALAEFLPLNRENWILKGNALQLDWTSVCRPEGSSVKVRADNLFHDPLEQTEIDFANAGGETYLCGNPPYQGSVNQTPEQKSDMAAIFSKYLKAYKDLDYVASWFLKAAEYVDWAEKFGSSEVEAAFVCTNSISQGEQVGMLWPVLFRLGLRIKFAHTSFTWANNATNNAGVTCIIVGLSRKVGRQAMLYDGQNARETERIGPYLVPGSETIVTKSSIQISGLPAMGTGNQPTDDGNFLLQRYEVNDLLNRHPEAIKFIRRIVGSRELIRGEARWCLWIDDQQLNDALRIPSIAERIERVRKFRLDSRSKQANDGAAAPHRFVFAPHITGKAIVVPSVSSERRPILPCAVFDGETIVSNLARVMYNAPLWSLSLIASRLHLVWIGTVCGKLKTDYRYSNTLGWNTFPVPPLTQGQKDELTRCAEGILIAREAHFPGTIADLYDPETMPEDLRRAHERNDETLERIYIGRRFKNDTERLEKLFEMYTAMTAAEKKQPGKAKKA